MREISIRINSIILGVEVTETLQSLMDHGRMVKPVQGREGNDLEGIGIEANRPGAGAPNVDKSGKLKLRKGQTLTKVQWTDNSA
ncbi:hypothetical protein OS493_016265 [Desmophyllum pertusum]|uniref:Uncharacterized protein n=1 Tax=Desmophyllum pertusum TaxID=174260 RepID=A0A9X0A2T5_9CNID|nr:hypothetical protein OS493_016265 [Desmophyllum pertusum]